MKINIKILTENKTLCFALIILSLFLTISLLQYILLIEETSFIYPYALILLTAIIIGIGYWKTILHLFHYLCYLILNEKVRYSYANDITRERWFISIGALLITLVCVKILFNTELTFNSTWIYLLRNTLILCFIIGLVYINQKTNNSFAAVSPEYNNNFENNRLCEDKIEAIKSNTIVYIKGDKSIINNFFSYKGENVYIKNEKKLIWMENEGMKINGGNKQTLIELISIIFDSDDWKIIVHIANTFFYFKRPVIYKNYNDWLKNKTDHLKVFSDSLNTVISDNINI